MTKILIPIPQTPIGDPKTLKVTREWYRYFSLLQEAVGGDTNVINDSETLSFPAESAAGIDPLAPFDLGAPSAARFEELQNAANTLPPEIPGPVEFGQLLWQAGAQPPFPMPPTELGSLEAAKNLGYRVVAAGNAVLVAGTVTVNSAYANAANEWSLAAKVVGGTQGILSVGTVTANASFIVNSSNAADTSTVSWAIFAPIKG